MEYDVELKLRGLVEPAAVPQQGSDEFNVLSERIRNDVMAVLKTVPGLKTGSVKVTEFKE